MRPVTRNELVYMRAAELLAKALAKAKDSEEWGLLLNAAMMDAEEGIGENPTRNPVAMCLPVKVLVNGHANAPRGDDGPVVEERDGHK